MKLKLITHLQSLIQARVNYLQSRLQFYQGIETIDGTFEDSFKKLSIAYIDLKIAILKSIIS